jgi:metal-sulfur cluster biosynthetic enzyme
MDEIKTTPASPATTTPATPPDLPQNLKDAMRALRDPEIGMDAIQLGLIRAVRPGENEVELDMILTTPFCPYGGWLIQQAKDITESVYNKPVKVNVLPDLWDPNLMEDPGLLMGW